jgi:hypothetical protein
MVLSDVACASDAGMEGDPVYEQEHINFPQYRDPLPGRGRAALHLLCRPHRRLGAGVGGVDHNG